MGQREFGLSFEHDGTVYSITPDDFTAYDDLAVQQATGQSLTRIFSTLRAEPSLFGVAALLWRYRVNDGEDDLTFTEVAKTFRFTDIKTVSADLREDEAPKA